MLRMIWSGLSIMEDKNMCRKIIYVILALLLWACEPVNKQYVGIVIDKEHREGYIRLQYIGEQLLPMPVPERYILVVQDSTGKARGVKVSAESYYRIEIGDSVNLR